MCVAFAANCHLPKTDLRMTCFANTHGQMGSALSQRCDMWHAAQAEGLMGTDQATHAFARARLGEQALQTSVQWQNTSPIWEEALSFRWEPCILVSCHSSDLVRCPCRQAVAKIETAQHIAGCV